MTSRRYANFYMIYLIAQRDGIDYKLAYIGEDFQFEHKKEFDINYLRGLYEFGYQ